LQVGNKALAKLVDKLLQKPKPKIPIYIPKKN